MNEQLKMAGMLTLVTMIAAVALAGVNLVTKPRIEAQKRLALERALTIALPQANKDAIVPVYKDDNVLYYKGYAKPDTSDLVGYAFVAFGKGYSSTIETMVGVDTTGKICGVKVLYQVETPGLGTKIEEIRHGQSKPWFQQQFIRKDAKELVVDKDGGDIQSITGATISSRAVTKSIAQGMGYLKEEVGGFVDSNK